MTIRPELTLRQLQFLMTAGGLLLPRLGSLDDAARANIERGIGAAPLTPEEAAELLSFLHDMACILRAKEDQAMREMFEEKP